MKRAVLIICLSLFIGVLHATPDSLFQAGNTLYQEGKYEMALETYGEIIQMGFETAGLYYNMGNAAYRSNNIGYAILYFEKTLKLDPSHEDAANNLEFASRYRVDTFEEVPELFIRTWIRSFFLLLPERAWSILSLTIFILFISALLIYIFSRKLLLKKLGFFVSLIAFFLFILSFTGALKRHRSIINPEAAIILSPSVVVRSSPSDTGTELFILHEGTKVKINEGLTGWQNIRVIDGREGWITSDDFGSI
ncbi:MAG: tetratricopeptide repeat protein [Bacteroidota bacterium]